jgi:TPP-dependent pyruvate/acetoin dehydrogenase alpha subunit
MSDQLNRVTARLKKLKVAEEKKAKTIIKGIQQKVDESAKKMATQNAEYQKRKQELEVSIGIWNTILVEYTFFGRVRTEFFENSGSIEKIWSRLRDSNLC